MSKSVILVEGDRRMRELVQYCLEANGFQVRPAEGAAIALTLAEQEPPALVICEVNLPGASGLELCKTLVEKGIKVLFLTAQTKPQDEETGLAAGASRYVAKPVLGKRLAETIAEVL